MIAAKEILNQAQSVTVQLVRMGLSAQQHFPSVHEIGNSIREITIRNSDALSIALRNVSYREIYLAIDAAGAYNVKLLDGALLQMSYAFDHTVVAKHRLAFFPSPDLEEYQNNPDIYSEDELYADIVEKGVVSFPIRFDYDSTPPSGHPRSHLTLGQYRNCRIPVTAPLTPFVFVAFILRNFYNTAFDRISDRLAIDGNHFGDVITPQERAIPHLRLREVVVASS